MVYTAGNFIGVHDDKPYLQLGGAKYGKLCSTRHDYDVRVYEA